MTIIVIILLLLISKTKWKAFLRRKKSNVSVCCFCPFSRGSLSLLGMGQTVIASLSSAVPVSTTTNIYSLYFLLCTFLPSVLWLAECSVHGITTVCASTAVRVSALAVRMCTNTTICQQLPLTSAWLLRSKKAADSDVWFYSIYFLCDLLISMLIIYRASYKFCHCSPLCCVSLAVLLVS